MMAAGSFRQDERKTKEKIVAAVLASAGVFLTILFFAPLQIYMTNRFDFLFAFPKVFFYFLTITACSIVLAAPLLAILPDKMHRRVVALVVVFSLLFWLQGNILVRDYGVFDGRKINWDAYRLQEAIDLLLWFCGTIVAVKRSEWFYKRIRWLVLWLFIVQGISVLFVMGQADSRPARRYGFTTNTVCDFSPKRNVIIFLFDSFQSDIFQELVDEDPSLKAGFEGFTYFNNALGGYTGTKGSIPFIFSGNQYDNSIPLLDFVKQEFLLHSILRPLKDRGFRMELYPLLDMSSYYLDPSIASNLIALDDPLLMVPLSREMYSGAFFRYAPQFLKRHLRKAEWLLGRQGFHRKIHSGPTPMKSTRRNPTTAFMRESVPFLRGISRELSLSAKNDVFKYIHFFGLHAPLVSYEGQAPVELKVDRQGHKRIAGEIVDSLVPVLSSLKRIGGYDNSLIIIISDHGSDSVIYSHGRYYGCDPDYRCRGLALMLIKPFNSRGNMKTSAAPVTLGDIPATIASALGLPNDYPGIPVFKVAENTLRQRRFLSGGWEEGEFFPDLTEYAVSGPVEDMASWRLTGRKFSAPRAKKAFDYRLAAQRITALFSER